MEEVLAKVIVAQLGAGGLMLMILIAALWKLYSDQRKTLVESVHQLNRELVSKRATAYSSLWSRMEPLAIYSTSSFDPEKSKILLEELSSWYFSNTGGLFLTDRAREFYFSLQSFTQSIANIPDWICLKRPENTKELFMTLLDEMTESETDAKHVLECIKEDQLDRIKPKIWKSTCKLVLDNVLSRVKNSDTQSGDLIFASVQQISSILRTNLTHEVHSRLSVDWPEI